MKVDMSPKAVTARLRQVSQLRNVCYVLGKAGKAHREKKDLVAKETPLISGEDSD